MNTRNKKSRTSVATPEREPRQGFIADLLSAGGGNAVPLSHLIMLTGWDARDVRRQIERERRAGVPICADNKTGYFLPTCELERDRCVQSMRHRAEEIQVTAECIAAGKLFDEVI